MFYEALLFLGQKHLMKFLYLSTLLTVFIFLSFSIYSQNKKFEINPELVEDFYHHETINIENGNLCYNLIEKIIYDLDQDGMNDTIMLYHIDLLKNDPGDFHRIKINLANGYCLDKLNIGGWVKNIRFKTEKNEICSNYLTIEKYEDFVFLMCFGYSYASMPGILTIWDFSMEKSRIIFNQPFLLKEFIGKKNTVLSGYKYYQEAGSETVSEEYVLQINDEQLQLKKKSKNIQ